MSKVTRVDVPSVDGAMNDLHGIADRFETAVAQIKQVAADLHGCWGDDDFGQKFAEGYLPYADETLKNGDLTVGDLRDIETNIRTIVRMFQDLDTSGAHVLELQDP